MIRANLDEVKEIIDKIKKKSAGATFIYRGEAECYCKVSSSLYRVCAQLEAEDFFGDTKDIQGVMKELEGSILEMSKTYLLNTAKNEMLPAFNCSSQTNQGVILSLLQHYGGATNLIDFTRSYTVALFFACNKAPGKNGRVILLEESVGEGKGYRIVDPSKAISRAKAQESVFVASDTGVLEIEKDKDMVVCIRKDLKLPILNYLSDHYCINTQSIYDDWVGVIERVDIYRAAFRELAKAQKCEKNGDYKTAIEHYNAAQHYRDVVATPRKRWFELYIRRAQVHLKRDDYAAADDDYSVARRTRDESEVDRMAIAAYTEKIESNPCDANAYFYRGKVYAPKSESDKASPSYQKALDNAIADYRKAIELNPDNAEAYYELGSVYAFKGDLAEAIQNSAKAIERDATQAKFFLKLGSVYETLSCVPVEPGRSVEVEEALRKALKSYKEALALDLDDTSRVRVHYECGVFHFRLGDFNKGREAMIDTLAANKKEIRPLLKRLAEHPEERRIEPSEDIKAILMELANSQE